MLNELTRACEEVLGVEMTSEQKVEVQRRIAHTFGGERVYVPKRANFTVATGYDMSGGVHEVMRRYRVSRRTAYRIVRGK